MTADLEELKININAVLTSGGGRLTEQQFLRDYRSLIGNIQFAQYGHNNLKSLLLSLGGYYLTKNAAGESVINAGYDEKTAHIRSLIARQKKKPGKKKSASRVPLRPMVRRPPPTYYSRTPSYPSVVRSSVVRTSAPVQRFANPPIIPQRTPLAAQNRLNPATALNRPSPVVAVNRSNSTLPTNRSNFVSAVNGPSSAPAPSRPTPVPAASKPTAGAVLIKSSPVPAPNKPTPGQNRPSPVQNKPTPVQNKAEVQPLKTAAQDRLSHRTIDVGASQSRIMSVTIDNKLVTGQLSNTKVSSSIVESQADASVDVLDVQWLQKKVDTGSSCRPKSARKEQEVPANSQLNATPQSSALGTNSLPSFAIANGPSLNPALVNGMRNCALSIGPTIVTPLQHQEVIHPLNQFIPCPQLPAQGPVPLMSLPVQPPPLNPAPQVTSRGRLTQQVTFRSHVEELSHLVSVLGLGKPVYKYVERKPTGKKAVFIAKVKIGESLLSSYPDEKATCEEAQELVAKLACEDLRNRPKETENVDDAIVLERVFKIIENKSNGMVESGIVKEYENMFGTSLPISWLEVIGNSPKFTIEQSLTGRGNAILYPVLSPQDPIFVLPVLPSPTSNGSSVKSTIVSNGGISPRLGNFSKEKLFQDINANTLPCSMPSLVKPEPKDRTWDVYVASVSSNENVLWVRFIGDDYDAKYNDLMTDLEIKMFSSSEPVPNPIIDDFYCCKFDNNWLRVQLKEIVKSGDGSEDEGMVFLIDNGELDTIPLSELRVIDKEYLRLPAQAVSCSLAYVDVTYDDAQNYIMNNVIGSSFVAEVLEHSENNPKIVLYNTENEMESVNVNISILESVVKNLKPPKFKGGLNKVRLTYVEKETRPVVQLESKELLFLEQILDDISLIDVVAIHGVNAHPRLNMDAKHIFLVKSKRCPNTFRRGVIVNTQDKRNPLVKFVDYGYIERVLVSDIFDAKKILSPVGQYPIQALEVSLADIPESHLVPGVVKRLRELAPPDEFLLGRLDQSTGDLKLFKKINDLYSSINDSIVISFDELKNIPEDTKVESKPTVTASRGAQNGSTSPLAVYQIPTASEFFNVNVSMSSNPSNFVVQPVDELNQFNNMMKSMQEFYEASHHIMETPPIEELQESRAFAAKHPDDLQWYRVSVVATLGQNVVSVRYSDYGDVGLVAIDRIRYLEPDFKNIPALAIRARLHGIKPLNGDWSVEECCYFNNLVQDNSYVSVIQETNQNLVQNSWQLSLTLIDTSQEDIDLNIADHMISRNYAIRG